MRLFRFVCCAIAAAGLGVGCATQQPVGLIGSDVGKMITAFDAETHALRGSVNVPASGDRDAYALAIAPSGDRAYVSDRFGRIHRVLLTGAVPTAPGVPIRPSHTASDLALLPHREAPMLVAVGTDTASTAGRLSTIDPAAGTELDRVLLGDATPYAVAACDDGRTVLVGTGAPHAVRRFTVSEDGQLAAAEATLPTPHPVANVYCAPGSQMGVVVSSAGARLQSFDLGSMRALSTRRLAAESATPAHAQPLGLSGVFAPAGDRVFVRSERGDFMGQGFVEAFDVDPAAGTLGPATHRIAVAPLAAASRGTGEIAIHPDGHRLYVADAREDRVLVLAPSTLAPVDTLRGPALDAPFGVAVGRRP